MPEEPPPTTGPVTAPGPAGTPWGAPAAALCELDVVVGADIGELRRVLGAAVGEAAVGRGATVGQSAAVGEGAAVGQGPALGLSSSLLGTLDPLAMPGGFRPLVLGQPDALVWVPAPDLPAAAAAAARVSEVVAGPATVRRTVIGSCRGAGASTGAPVIADGPAVGGTYVVLIPGAGSPVTTAPAELVVEPEGGPAVTVLLLAELGLLTELDAVAVAAADAGRGPRAGGLYLMPDPAAARRLTAVDG